MITNRYNRSVSFIDNLNCYKNRRLDCFAERLLSNSFFFINLKCNK